jgi:hypothetical protein
MIAIHAQDLKIIGKIMLDNPTMKPTASYALLFLLLVSVVSFVIHRKETAISFSTTRANSSVMV